MDELTDVAAERAVLAGIYKYGEEAYVDVAEFLQISTFSDETNSVIYKVFENLFKQGVTTLDISSILAGAGELGLGYIFEDKTELEHLNSIFNTQIFLPNVRKWAAKIRHLEIARLLKTQLKEAQYSLNNITGTESLEHIVGIAESVIFDFSKLIIGSENSPELLGKDLDEYIQELKDNPCKLIGIDSGLPHYNTLIGGGFRRKTVSLIGARMKSGKSVLCINIGEYVSEKLKIPVLYLDTEMNKLDHWSRLLANITHNLGHPVEINDIERGEFAQSEEDSYIVGEAAHVLKNIPLYYHNIAGKPFEDIVGIMRRWVHRVVGFNEDGSTKDCLILYDYLKLMDDSAITKNIQEYQALGFMTTTLQNFAIKHDVPIFVTIQLNRDGIDKEDTSVFAGSDRILWLVTNYAIFKQKSPEEIAQDGVENGNRKLVVLNSRHGEGNTYGDYINVQFWGKYAKIKELNTKHNIQAQKKSDGMGVPQTALIPNDPNLPE